MSTRFSVLKIVVVTPAGEDFVQAALRDIEKNAPGRIFSWTEAGSCTHLTPKQARIEWNKATCGEPLPTLPGERRTFTVIGTYEDNGGRYAQTTEATSAHEAEDKVIKSVEADGNHLCVAAVVEGDVRVLL